MLGSVLAAIASVAASVQADGTSTGFSAPTAAVPTPDGGSLVADEANCVVKKISASGAISTVAGNGTCPNFGSSATGDGGPATSAQLSYPTDAVPTSDGGFLVSSYTGIDCRVRKVSAAGIITTVAGTAGLGNCGNSGDHGPATSAQVSVTSVVPYHAAGAAVDTPGSGFLIAGGCVVRKVDGAGTITTVAGNGTCGPAHNSLLAQAVSCSVNPTPLCAAGTDAGGITISTNPAAANPTYAVSHADGSNRINAISCPSASFCLAVDDHGNAVASNNPGAAAPTWTVTPTGVVGNRMTAVSCASSALCVAVDADGNAVISTTPGTQSPVWTFNGPFTNHYGLFGVSCPSTTLCAVAGGLPGDVSITTNPTAASPAWTTKQLTSNGDGTSRVSCVSTALCVVTTGGLGRVYSSTNPTNASPTWMSTTPDSGSGLSSISCPSLSLCVGADQQGNSVTTTTPQAAAPGWTVQQIGASGELACGSPTLCIGVSGTSATKLITSTNPGASTPTWTPTEALGSFGKGDGQPAVTESLATPTAAVPTPDGGFLLTEAGGLSAGSGNGRIRKVSSAGTITTVAGTGVEGYSGDGGPATSADLYIPTSAVPTPDGGFLISEAGNCVVRKVSAAGTITTVAGVAPSGPTLHCGNSGAGGPATSAQLYEPTAAVPAADGSVLVGSFASPPGSPANDAAVDKVLPSGQLVSALTPFTPLTNVSLPMVTGTSAVNATLMCSQGLWSSPPTSYAYKWNRDGGAIAGAAGPSYKVAAADAGHKLTCTVTATASTGTSSATSSPGLAIPGSGGGPGAPKCSFTKTSSVVPLRNPPKPKHKPKVPAQAKNTLAFSLRCNQAASVKASGVIKESLKDKHHKLVVKSVSLGSRKLSIKANVTASVTLAVPGAAITALKKGINESATLTLVATNAHGTGRATAKIPRLKPKK